MTTPGAGSLVPGDGDAELGHFIVFTCPCLQQFTVDRLINILLQWICRQFPEREHNEHARLHVIKMPVGSKGLYLHVLETFLLQSFQRFQCQGYGLTVTLTDTLTHISCCLIAK